MISCVILNFHYIKHGFKTLQNINWYQFTCAENIDNNLRFLHHVLLHLSISCLRLLGYLTTWWTVIVEEDWLHLFTSQFYPWVNWELLLCSSYSLCSGELIIKCNVNHLTVTYHHIDCPHYASGSVPWHICFPCEVVTSRHWVAVQ